MKRFTETLKWGDPWFRKLTPAAKLLFLWMVDNCDNAGVIELDFEMAEFQIGGKISESNLAELNDRVERLPNGKHRVVKFVTFQFGNNLQPKSNLHASVIKLIETHGLNGAPEGKESEAKATTTKFKKPTIAELELHAAKIGLPNEEVDKFLNYYESNGWRVGRNPMKSWEHALVNWKNNLKNYGPKQFGKQVVKPSHEGGF